MRNSGSWLAVGLALASATAAAQTTLPKDSSVPGGVAIVPLVSGGERPIVHFGDQRVLVVPGEHGGWEAIVGLPLESKPGTHRLTVETPEGGVEELFRVRSKSYPVQHVTLKNKDYVDPTPTELARIQQERETLAAAFGTWSEALTPELNFDPPVRGRLTSTFGLKRYFNQQPRAPHSGLDIALPEGTSVAAPAPARVIATGNFFFNGNTVLLDHGQGVISMYCHLKKIEVVPGDMVSRGQILGEVGMTGRATGPHLHWTVSLNGNAVDPSLFVAGEPFVRPAPKTRTAQLKPVATPASAEPASPPALP